MKIAPELRTQIDKLLAGMDSDRTPWWKVWRMIAQYYLPVKHTWLTTENERANGADLNNNILDATGTLAAETLAAGMLNGITSPSRPWFNLRISNFDFDLDHDARVWLDEVVRRMMKVMAESNFYNSLSTHYLDLGLFGSASMLIYEDYEQVIRCYNSPIGEFYFGLDNRLTVNRFARKFKFSLAQVVDQFGIENLPESLRARAGDVASAISEKVTINHLIEPNTNAIYKGLPKSFAYREIFWTPQGEKDEVLSVRGYHEWPGLSTRWNIVGGDAYGTCPAMNALGDVIQLQHETKRKGQSLDFMVRPPLLLDQILQNQPHSLLPGGKTFVPNVNTTGGGKPVYQFVPPIQELSLDIAGVQKRIREQFFNDLFQQISQLDTVRSAAEIYERKEEKMLRLGPVLERFHNEGLNRAIRRIYAIMDRAKLFPEPPTSIQGKEIEIQYISILATAQSAAGVAPTERLLQVIGNTSAVWPELKYLPNIEELVREYARNIGVSEKGINSSDEYKKLLEQLNQQADTQNAVSSAEPLAKAAQLLSQTDVGGGSSALQEMM